MDRNTAKRIINQALKELIEKDNSIIKLRVKEECINHKFAIYIEKFLNEVNNLETKYDVDLEYNKSLDNPKKIVNIEGRDIPIRPDILVHKRQNPDEYNLIAIEVKKDYTNNHDLAKIKGLLKDFNYTFGFLISYLPNKSYIRVKFYQKLNSQEPLEEIYKIPKITPSQSTPGEFP